MTIKIFTRICFYFTKRMNILQFFFFNVETNICRLNSAILQCSFKKFDRPGLWPLYPVDNLLQKLPGRRTLLGVVDVKNVERFKTDINCPKECWLGECLTCQDEEHLRGRFLRLSQGQDSWVGLGLLQIFHNICSNLRQTQRKIDRELH